MKWKRIFEVESECKRLLAKIQELKDAESVYRYEGERHFTKRGPRAAAVKRSSMDVTRALARLRQEVM